MKLTYQKLKRSLFERTLGRLIAKLFGYAQPDLVVIDPKELENELNKAELSTGSRVIWQLERSGDIVALTTVDRDSLDTIPVVPDGVTEALRSVTWMGPDREDGDSHSAEADRLGYLAHLFKTATATPDDSRD
jgi:hypothetical protein